MATSSLGRLTLDLAVRLSEFTEGMSRAERETADRTRNMQESVTSFREHLASELGGTQLGGIIDSFNQRFGSIEGSITKVSAAFAGMAVGGIAVGIGALSKMAIETAKADAELAVFANRANTTVANFQTLATASEGLGVNQEQLASILADTQEKLGEFTATGAGGAADFFDALKNNTKMTDDQIKEFGKTLTGKDGVEAIQLIKNKLDDLGASAQEQRFVFESLGSDLGNLSVIFANGGTILNQYRDALEEAGVIKTKEAIEQSQLLAAQTQSVKQRFDGFKSQLTGAMMPVLNSLAQHFLKGGEKASGFGGIIQGVGIIAKGVAAVILTFSTVVGAMGNTIGATLAQLGNIATTAMNVWNADGLEAKAQAIADGFRNAKNMTGDWWSTTLASLRAADKTMGDLVNGQTTAADRLTQANLAVIKSQNQRTNGLKLNTKEADANAKATEKAAKATINHAKAQQSAQARLVGISGNSGIGSGAHLDIRVSGGGRRLTSAELARFQADGKPLTAYRKTSDYGYRGNIGVSGASKYHRGIDFKMPVGTPITTKVPVKSVSNFYDSKGGGYVQRIVFEDGLSVDLLHQSPASKGIKGGSSATKTPYSSAKSESYSLIAKSNEDAKREAEQREKERQRQLEQDARDRQSLAEKYYTEEQRINAEHDKNMAEINRLYVRGTKEYHDALVLENERYLKEYSEYEWKLGEKARAQLALIDKIKDDIGNSVMQSTNDYLDATMKASMSPEQYAKWSMQRDYNNQYSLLYGQYENRQNEINATDERGNFRIDDETERNALLEQARQEHLAKLYTLESEHNARVKEMNDADNQPRLSIWGQGLDAVGSVWGQLTDIVTNAYGKQSAAARAFFFINKTIAAAQAVVNTEEAATKALAQGGALFGVPMATIVRASGYASAGIILGQGIAGAFGKGFAEGGYTGTGSKYTPAGIVHAGEIVWSQADIKRWGGVDVVERMRKAKGYADGGIVGGKNYMTKVTNDKLIGGGVQVNVVVNADGSSDVQANTQMGKQMGDAIKAAVLQTIVQEKRQGGLLSAR